jgi:hypothetical protein
LIGDPVPYERQIDAETERRMCGAAALAMVYRSFGLELTQQQLWPNITGRNPRGTIHAKSFLLCRDALSRGFLGLVLKAQSPWELLLRTRQPGTQVIVNHRVNRETAAGHYSVVVACNQDEVTLHDPRMGPDRKIPKAEFLELWQPNTPRSEITGNIAIVITKNLSDVQMCATCQNLMPPAYVCATCKRTVPLQPSRALGCLSARCGGRLWSTLFCPYCDSPVEKLDSWNPAALLKSQTGLGAGSTGSQRPEVSKANSSQTTSGYPGLNISKGQRTGGVSSPEAIHGKLTAEDGDLPRKAAAEAGKGNAMNPDLPTSVPDALDKLRAIFSSPGLKDLDTVSRERLNDLVSRLQEGHDQTMDHLKEMASKWQAKADELQQSADAMKAKMEAAADVAKKAPPVPPPSAVKPPAAPAVPAAEVPAAKEEKLDPKTGAELRERLLSRFGKRPPTPSGPAPSGIDDRVDWKDWLDNQ